MTVQEEAKKMDEIWTLQERTSSWDKIGLEEI